MKIVIRGEARPPAINTESTTSGLWLKSSYAVAGNMRALADPHTVDVGNDDLVEFVFNDDTTWLCGSDSLVDLFPDAPVKTRSSNEAFEIPVSISPVSTDRSLVGDAAIKLINIFGKKGLNTAIKTIAGKLEEAQLGTENIGLRRLDSNFKLQRFVANATSEPYLLFLHGTASSTDGSFSGLLGNSQVWKQICQTYGENILAFQHRTLTESPLENVQQLLASLPDKAVLHLVSHSRGGLIGDVLSRFCIADHNNSGFSEDEIAYLEKCGRDADLQAIDAIKNTIATKNISIRKYIRVACPAAGTTLASKRMDHLFNMIGNLLGIATGASGSTVYNLFRQLIGAVINTKNDQDALPGLEAMDPDSPFIKILNDPNFSGEIETALTVISGNCKVKLNLKALTIIASKLFFLRNNDLIVNTGAMYRGAKRTQDLQYFFDEETDVDHFSYFKNSRTQDILLLALLQKDQTLIPGFSYMTREQAALQRNALLNLDGGKLYLDKVTGKRPIAVIIPGIMGSNLNVGSSSIWINYWKFATGHLKELAYGNGPVTAPSIVATSYRKLAEYLSDEYDVVTFPFDWRLQMNENATLFNKKIQSLMSYKQPIKIIGHSLGGVLMRDFMVTYPDTWQLLNASRGFRLLFLGAPLGGSFRIPNVLFGKDPIINKINQIDIFHTKQELISIFAQLPGLLSLLPLNEDADNDMASAGVWNKMKKAYGINDWPVPDAERLEEFKAYRKGITAAQDTLDYSNAIYIAGHDTATPYGYKIEQKAGGEELVFMSTSEGDQSVTWESGIPQKMIALNKVYYVEVTHGALANNPPMFKGISELLVQGTTQLLNRQRPQTRSAEKIFRTPDLHDFDISPDGLEDTILGLDNLRTATITVGETPVKTAVVNGDLLYASYPILAGHFSGDGILYAEHSIDKYLNNALSQRHVLGLYPGPIGTNEVILTPNLALPGAIIVGMDDPGSLTAYRLAQTVEQGVCNFLLHMNGNKITGNQIPGATQPALGISALVIGCGYGGLTIENSVRAILQGVRSANTKIKKLLNKDALLIGYVEFMERYEDRALSCLQALNKLAKDGKGFNIQTVPGIKTRMGLQRRYVSGGSEEWWNRITVKRTSKQGSPKVQCLQFNSASGGAREEERELYSSIDILSGLIQDISANNAWSPQSAKTIFELMIPNDFKEQLKKQCNVIWILDKDTATFPWELLHDGNNDTNPLSVDAGMVRQLSTKEYRLNIGASIMKKSALIVADPDLKGFINQLPAAKKEGEMVLQLLRENGYDFPVASVNQSASDIIEKLFATEYKVIHLAGHGVFNAEVPEASGMVIGSNTFLSTREIAQMSSVPEFVFVNCCYLGKTDGVAESLYADRYKLAANIGTQLIQNGVKAVIAAGWAVDDNAAHEFTRVFYDCMFDGYNFGDAVRQARKFVFDNYKGNNTWGAYQCYGDPFYKLTTSERWHTARTATYSFDTAPEAETELFNLRSALDMPGNSVKVNLDRLVAIGAEVDRAGIRNAAITELEANIYSELGEYGLAVMKFGQLMSTENAAFSFAAAEKYCNIRSKKMVADFMADPGLKAQSADGIEQVIQDLQHLIDFKPTAERYSILGSAWKRKSILSDDAEFLDALAHSAVAYRQASLIQQSSPYPLVNSREMETLLVLAGQHSWGKAVDKQFGDYTLLTKNKVLEQLHTLLQQASISPDAQTYWDLIYATNIQLCILLVEQSKNDDHWAEVKAGFLKVWQEAGSELKRASEREHLYFLKTTLARIASAPSLGLSDRLGGLLDGLSI